MKNGNVALLIVDDETAVRDSLSSWFQKDGYDVAAAADGVEALKKLSEKSWDIVLLDIKMPNIGGMELLKRIRKIDQAIVTIMITAYASVDTAVEALKCGAWDYVTKPIDPDDLSRIIRKAVDQRRLKKENVQLRTTIEDLESEDDLIGESPEIERIRGIIDTVSRTDVSVLIHGGSGTGKEVVARMIHARSERRYLPLVAVNCGALHESLLESELFGHEKGAFTGAQYKHRGKLEIANGGTLFLDEIGTISLKTQVDLLRVLDTMQFTRLGGNQVISVDFRVICATNQDIEQLVREGHFREDFFYRINVFPMVIPPLSRRRADIPLFIDHFLVKYSQQNHKQIDKLSPGALEMMMNHDWPGNVRELKNAIERAVVVCTGSEILPEHLPIHVNGTSKIPESDTLESIEKAHIERMLGQWGWNITKTAMALGIDRVTLYNKIRKYGLRK